MTRKLIVFDWNGTILSDTAASWKAANISLAFHGKGPITLRRYRETFYFPVIHFYRLNGCDVDDVLARKAQSNALFQAEYEKLAASCRTRRGARELLAWARDHGWDRMILSNYRTDKIKAQLDRLGLAEFFQHVSAHGGDGSRILEHTSKQERLETYLKTHQYEAQDAVIIGDSMEEPEIARHLGLTSIGITDGGLTRARLAAARPDYTVHSLTEVISLLERFAEIRKT